MSRRKFNSGDIPRVMSPARYIATVVGALAIAALTWSNVHSQITNPGVTISGAISVNDCIEYGPGVNQIRSAGGPCAATVTPAALTKQDDTNITLTLTGTPATALLEAVDIAAGWTGTLGLSRGGWGADISAQAGVPSLAAGTFSWLTRGDITRTNDTNVTLTLGGTPVNSVFNGVSMTLGWSGTLAAGRLNSNVVQGVTNDTNVTGSIAAQNLTLGWSGTLARSRGGTSSSNGAFISVNVQTFTASGTYTPSSGLLYAVIECIGGGGGSGPALGAANQLYAGGGGASGGYSRRTASAATIGASQTVTIGAGGSAGTGTNNGGTGGQTSVGSLCVANGGGGGNYGHPGQLGLGGAAAAAGTGEIALTGNQGGIGQYNNNGFTAINYLSQGGIGSASRYGAQRNGGNVNTAGCNAGVAGANYGSGAGAAACINTTSAADGAAGSAGFVVITEFLNQ